VSPAVRRPLRHRQLCLLLAGSLVVLNLIWRLGRYLANPPLWDDEAMLAINFQFRDDLAGFLEPLLWSQLAPPGFLWLTELLTQAVGHHEMVLRLVPVLAGSVATAAFGLFCLRCLRSGEAAVATMLLAASYFPLRHSVELKPYAIDLLVAVAALWLTIEIGRKCTPWKLAIWTLLGAIAVWMSFPAVLVFAGSSVWLILQRRRLSWFAALAGSVIGGSFLLMYLAYADVRAAKVDQYQAMQMWSGAFPPWSQPWMLPIWLVEVHAGRMLSYPNGGKNFGSIATLLLCIAGGYTLWQTKRRHWLGLLLLPAAVGLVAASAGAYPYGRTVRTMLYLAPAICLLAGVGGWGLLRMLPRRRLALGVVAALLAILPIAGLAEDLRHPYKEPFDRDLRESVRHLADQSVASDVWLFARAGPRNDFRPDEFIVAEGVSAAAVQHYAMRWSPAKHRNDLPSDATRVWLIAHETDAWNERLTPGRFAPFEPSMTPHRARLRNRGYELTKTVVRPAGRAGHFVAELYEPATVAP
jgi:hypothetical protein